MFTLLQIYLAEAPSMCLLSPFDWTISLVWAKKKKSKLVSPILSLAQVQSQAFLQGALVSVGEAYFETKNAVWVWSFLLEYQFLGLSVGRGRKLIFF